MDKLDTEEICPQIAAHAPRLLPEDLRMHGFTLEINGFAALWMVLIGLFGLKMALILLGSKMGLFGFELALFF